MWPTSRDQFESPLLAEETAYHSFALYRIFSSIVVNAIYGIDTTGDEYTHLAEIALRGFSEFHVPGAYWVEYFPILRHLPRWLPGVQFKKDAEFYKPYVEKMIHQPFDEVKAAMVRVVCDLF